MIELKGVIIVLSSVIAIALSVGTSTKEPVPIVSQESDVEPDGKFHWSYESGDGTKSQQVGELKSFDKDHEGEVEQGSFEYKGDDGKTYSVSYVADENGFQPVGEHLPVAPEIPPVIARALEFLATAPPSKE